MQTNKSQKNRLKKLSIGILIALAIGMLYFLFVSIFGFGIPCPFHLLTHLKCPGCGITSMFVAIGHLDFIEAFWANPLTFCLLPFWIIFLVYLCILYVRSGSLSLPVWLNYIIIAIGIAYVIFGIVRNIPALNF